MAKSYSPNEWESEKISNYLTGVPRKIRFSFISRVSSLRRSGIKTVIFWENIHTTHTWKNTYLQIIQKVPLKYSRCFYIICRKLFIKSIEFFLKLRPKVWNLKLSCGLVIYTTLESLLLKYYFISCTQNLANTCKQTVYFIAEWL